MRSFATAAMALYPPRRSNRVFVASLIVSSSKLVVRQFALSKFFQQIYQIRNLRPLIQGSKVNFRRNESEPRMAEMGLRDRNVPAAGPARSAMPESGSRFGIFALARWTFAD